MERLSRLVNDEAAPAGSSASDRATPSHADAKAANQIAGTADRTDAPRAAPMPDLRSSTPTPQPWKETNSTQPFVPHAPQSLHEAKVTDRDVANLAIKLLFKLHNSSGRKIADHVRLPFALVESVLQRLRATQLVVYKDSVPAGDYVYQLTEKGHAEAERLTSQCSYFGAAPVHLDDYIASVHAQSIRRQKITVADLDGALEGLRINPLVFNQVGQALRAGRGFFIYGSPGNGKTTIAERIGRAYGQTVWIPRTLYVQGEIIRLLDPSVHVEVPLEPNESLTSSEIDHRWARIRRPTLIAGGELTMERLELNFNPTTGISEAPLQLKSNCGALVIDDFGRQRMSTAELLNRWIVPLDKQHDYLNLHNGQAIQVPFDQLLIFSTNLEPRDLVDEAFLRRMPYKIQVPDPSIDDFRWLLRSYADQFGVPFTDEGAEHLIQQHFLACGRQFRICHARDLLQQVQIFCEFNDLPVEMNKRSIDVAASNYFAIMGE